MLTRKLTFILMLAGLVLAGACSSDHSGPTATPLNGSDQAPPLAPSGLAAPEGKITSGGFLLTWSSNQEADVYGYRVYLYQPSPDRMEAYVPMNSRQTLTVARAAIQWDMSTPAWVRVSAVDASGNESALSEPFAVSFTASLPGDAGADSRDRDPRQGPSIGGPGGGQGHSDQSPIN